MKRAIGLVASVLAVTGMLGLSSAPAFAGGHHWPAALTCTGGQIHSGTYARITVTGACAVAPGAVIRVLGSVYVRAGATFDAQSAPSTITIGHDVIGGRGSFVGLGCQPPSYTGNSAHECAEDPTGHSTITVYGNVTAVHAAVVLLNGITVKGNVTLICGGSDVVPWSVKNSRIRGNLTVIGQTTSWLGVLFNTIGRNVTLLHITVVDEHPGAPGVYIVKNTVGRNLICWALAPGVSGGFAPGSVNVVGHKAYGQCAALV